MTLLLLFSCGPLRLDPTDTARTDTATDTADTGADTADSGADTADSVDPGPLPSCGWTGSGPYHIPDPGPGDGYCVDHETNDTPDQANPCGVADSEIAAQLYIHGSTGPDDPADWFVFVAGWSSTYDGQYSWWETDTDLLDQRMYEVTDDCTDLVLVAEWATKSTFGENTNHKAGIDIVPGTIYALEFAHGEGEGDWFT